MRFGVRQRKGSTAQHQRAECHDTLRGLPRLRSSPERKRTEVKQDKEPAGHPKTYRRRASLPVDGTKQEEDESSYEQISYVHTSTLFSLRSQTNVGQP